MEASLVTTLYHYHTWRVHRWVDHLMPLSAAHFATDIPGSFSPLAQLLQHLAGAERYLYHVVTGDPTATPPKPADEADTHAWLQHWAAVADLWLPLLASASPTWADEMVAFRTRAGSLPLRRLDGLLQNVDHCTYHTGQVTTALRHLGLDPPGTTTYLQYLLGGGAAQQGR